MPPVNNPSKSASAPQTAGAHRRARSASQPTGAPHPLAGSSTRQQVVDPLNFDFLDQFDPGPSSAPGFAGPSGFDQDAFTRALHHIQNMAPQHIPPQMPPVPPPLNPAQAQQIPNPMEAFLAALPWLQYMQMQNPFQQQQPHQQQPMPNIMQYMPPAMAQPSFTFSPPTGAFGEAEGSHMRGPLPVDSTPSPEGGDLDNDGLGTADDKRRRNTAASARFRIKKKQWTLNLERTISDLSGRVEDLEREAAELRRENGWLKEIVMLKSKRLSDVVPDLEPSTSSSAQSESHSGQSPEDPSHKPDQEDPKGKGKQTS